MVATLQDKIYSYIEHSSFFQDFIKSDVSPVYAEGLEGFALAVCILCIHNNTSKGNLWLIMPTEEEVLSMQKNLHLLNLESNHIESAGLKLYSEMQHGVDSVKRIRTFSKIEKQDRGIIISSLRSFSTTVPTKEDVLKSSITFRVGDHFSPEKFAELLVSNGYLRVPGTNMPGEFSIRGEVIDFFPYEFDYPVRMYIEWDEIEKIRNYDPLGQETFNNLEECTLFITDSGETANANFIQSYIKKEDACIFFGEQRLSASFDSLTHEAEKIYRELVRENSKQNLVKPEHMLFNYTTLLSSANNIGIIDDIRGHHKQAHTLSIMGPRSYFGNFTYFRDELKALHSDAYDITIFAGSENQKNRLEMMLKDEGVEISAKEISEGFSVPELKIIAICDHEIFGRRKKAFKALHHTKLSPLDTFVDLDPGDYVVHINYGIGLFKKIDRIKAAGKERDYIQIEYADGEYVFIPIEQANLIQRYIGRDSSSPRLDKLGGTSWEAKKRKARKNAEDLAERLIKLYARRKQSRGYAFSKDTDWQLQFESMFPFEETEDQITCILDVKSDMEKPLVMDRLICGDVGYGKTEIAIRAAFKAVMAGKQVAFLAPTTILAEQHFDTIVDRIHPFPMRVKMLSRLVPKPEQRKTLKKLEKGEIDILIGTHRIIQKDVMYHNLGILIVDEEQRFGVKDKEKIKEIKASVDCLALSATPIPRTLYMSLLKIRDMSLLTTPPIKRRSIKTAIQEFDEIIVKNAIEKEVKRGGQVFYLHNRIETLDQIVVMLKEMVPGVSVDFAHGQMDPVLLEEKMRLFVHNGIQVLVATTIIENGIDIPNVNTIIIDRADRYGVSQMYQLRGRVGRSDREAYAYLLYPNGKALSEVAMKRLKILSEHTDLGSGFKIAMKDMEMRGTGNLLGREQSGQMQAVGLDMYLRILDEEINRMSEDSADKDEEVFLDLDYSGFIPDSYITDPGTKFQIYRKIAAITKEIELKQLDAELEDRFGPIPETVQNLLYIAEIKVLCKKLAIYHLKEMKGIVRIEFSRVANIAVDRLIDMIKESAGTVTIDQKHPNIVIMKTTAVSLKDKSLFMLEKLQRLLQ